MRVPSTTGELAALVSDCCDLSQHIAATPGLHETPEAVFHFLSDADIRFKDGQYAAMQLDGLHAALAEWESTVAT